MRALALLALLGLVAGCESAKRIDRHTLDKLYFDTAMSPGVLSMVPLQIDPQAPPTVVNWWYAGMTGSDHVLVYRQLTWDDQRKPIGQEQQYRISKELLVIQEPFAYTKDAMRWLALYEVGQGIEPPADLPTARKAIEPIDSNPITLPSEAEQPSPD